MPNRVVRSINNDAGDRCVDIFAREDGTFGFEEYRQDHEDQRGWFSLQRYAHMVFVAEEEALERARSAVVWLSL